MIGITAYGAYIPRLRLARQAAAKATAWLNPSLMAHARGERAMANWDEDAVTMAVAAARDCSAAADDTDPSRISALYFASTTAPFAVRLNASIISAALGLAPNTAAFDLSSSPRCGVSSLLQALDHVSARSSGDALVVASDMQHSPAASPAGMLQGDAAAAIRLGRDNVIAEILGSHVETIDFVDSYRGANAQFEQRWEDRWIRDEGYLKLVPATVKQLLEKTNISADTIDTFVCPSPFRGVAARIASSLGMAGDVVVDHLEDSCGNSGAAHPLLVLAHTLEKAQPGQRIIVASFGQGCEALVLETTEACSRVQAGVGVQKWLDSGVTEANYFKYLVYRGLVDWDQGAEGEADKKTLLSALYRDRNFVNTLEGWHCAETGETFFGPEAEFKVSQRNQPFERKSFANSRTRLFTWSANYLGISKDSAICTGVVEFEEGGRLVMDFTEVNPEELAVGKEMEMSYRIHAVDESRGFTRYFWKAAPLRQPSTPEESGGKRNPA